MEFAKIAIVNISTLVSDADGQTIVDALNMKLPAFCDDWGLQKCTAVYVGKGNATRISLKVFLMDTSDVNGALGYHDITSNIPYGRCFAKAVIDVGGVILYTPKFELPTFAQIVCHEVFEVLWDPICNAWWDIGDGRTLVAAEVCDPVQDNDIVVTVPSKTVVTTVNGVKKSSVTPAQKVTLSDWILPSWSNPQRKAGPFNHAKTLPTPFTIDKNGYAIILREGETQYVYGSTVTPAKKAMIQGKRRVMKKSIHLAPPAQPAEPKQPSQSTYTALSTV
jgi:hypothetical protein